MNPMNRIYIVFYLHNQIQPSHAKHILKKKQNIFFILVHYFILRCPSTTHYEIML